jgi:hypothetical protein
MEIKFTVDAEQLNKALKVSSIISPQVTAEQERGYLFVIGGDDVCRVYSKNGGHEARSSFPVSNVEGEGSFMYPADYVGAFEYITGPIAFVATSEGKSFKVKYTHGASGAVNRVSFDPRSMSLFEKDIKTAMESQEPKRYSIKILQLAFGMAKPFVAKANEPVAYEHYKTVQIFGDENPELAKKANGYLLSSNGTEAFYFQSEAFLGKGLAAPGQHLPLLESFMAQSSGFLRVYGTEKGIYAVNEADDVIGWPHHEDTYKKFSYYTMDDTIIVKVDWNRMLHQLRYMRAELHKDKKKIQLHFNPSAKEFWFSCVDEGSTMKSLPVSIEEVSVSKIDKEVVANVNVDHMLHLFESAKGEWVEFRIRIVPPSGEKRPKELFMFRTIDRFLLGEDGSIAGGSSGAENVADGVHVCNVTRFTPGIE